VEVILDLDPSPLHNHSAHGTQILISPTPSLLRAFKVNLHARVEKKKTLIVMSKGYIFDRLQIFTDKDGSAVEVVVVAPAVACTVDRPNRWSAVFSPSGTNLSFRSS
jgi:hypothetical protein